MSRRGLPLCAVIGDPVGHSLSPEIFRFIALQTGRPVEYARLELPARGLEATLKGIAKLELFHGLNVTIPHKESVARLAHIRSPEVKALGAANVLTFKSGKLEAYNTDVHGIEETLREQGIALKRKAVLLLGAGGAARAAAFALGRQGAAEVWIANRDSKRAAELAECMAWVFPKTAYFALGLTDVSRIAGSVELTINSTPLGMKGFPSQSPLPSNARKGAWAFDLVYRPELTPFLKDAKKRGLKTVGGLDMLVWQALASWELWFGKLARKAELKKALAHHLRKNLL